MNKIKVMDRPNRARSLRPNRMDLDGNPRR
jgi:hypothetical protein